MKVPTCERCWRENVGSREMGGLAVAVPGPAGMSDKVRRSCAEIGKKGEHGEFAPINFVEESYTW